MNLLPTLRPLKSLTLNRAGTIAYALFEAEEGILPGKSCVFIDTANEGTGTVLGAEDLLPAICAAEGFGLEDVTFYDLKPTPYKRPYYCTFERLSFKAGCQPLFIERWMPEKCPPEVLADFRSHIGSLTTEPVLPWI